jgi:hypothetical protein
MSNKKDITTTATTLPFILVSDSAIANILKQNGYVCINETETMFTFMNNGKLTFSENIDKHKVMFTNKLCI